MQRHILFAGIGGLALALAIGSVVALAQDPAAPYRAAWPGTDFERSSIDFDEVLSGGPPRDGIPPIDDPSFEPVGASDLTGEMPVLSLELNGDARAYPCRF